MKQVIGFSKAFVKGHFRSDGTYVKDYYSKTPPAGAKPGAAAHVGGQKAAGAGGQGGYKEPPPPQGYHPKPGEDGEMVGIRRLSKPTPLSAFDDPKQVATVVPGGQMIGELGGVDFAPWDDAPQTLQEWAEVEGQTELDEPEIDPGKGMRLGAGVIVQEDDGRVWVVHPTNSFGGYRASFPKGTVEDGLSLQASAIKEAYEESGLKVQIQSHFMDVSRTTSVARYYLAKRVGGCPTEAGWESQAVSLVPVAKLYEQLNQATDHGLAEKLGAGPRPKPKEQKFVAQGGLFGQKPTFQGNKGAVGPKK